MPSNNNSSSSKMSMSFGKGKNNMAVFGLIVLLVAIGVAYYFIYKINNGFESFEGDSSEINPNLKPSSGECIVVLFYAPWCGHCKTFKPIFDDAMTQLDGKTATKGEVKGKKLRFSKVDCDLEENKPLAKKYGINGYPTVKILNDDGTTVEYDGKRTLDGMESFFFM